MRIAQVAPLYEAVPPRLYGGTERIIHFLTEELVRRGHDVTLFASGDSATSAKFVPSREMALRLDPNPLQSATAAHLAMLHEVRRRHREFDVIHVHLSHFIHFPIFEELAAKVVTTPHGRLDYADLPAAYDCWPDFPMISISLRQRKPLPKANWVANIYHGLPVELFPPVSGKPPENPYLAFLGRMSRAKRPDRAIEIARRTGMKLRIAAKVGADDRGYFQETIEPLLEGGDVEFVGEVDEQEKAAFLSGAEALLFPIDWPEPFGLVVIEAMAFGVPVIAWDEGAMPEIVDHGETGFIVDSVDDAVEAVAKARRLDRSRIRSIFEARFSSQRMVSDYEAAYAAIAEARARQPQAGSAVVGESMLSGRLRGLDGGRTSASG